MMAEIPEQAPLPPVEKLINGYNLGALSPFSALATGPHVSPSLSLSASCIAL